MLGHFHSLVARLGVTRLTVFSRSAPYFTVPVGRESFSALVFTIAYCRGRISDNWR